MTQPNTYIPRLQPPSSNDPYWIKTTSGGYNRCIYGSDGPPSVLPNCTGYVHGRWMELANRQSDDLGLPFGNGGSYWSQCDPSLAKGSEPQLGACACFYKNGDPGHVCIVEEISADQSYIVCSESGWGSSYFITVTRYRAYGWGMSASYDKRCLGFIYHPDISPRPPVTGRKRNRFNFVLFRKRRMINEKR